MTHAEILAQKRRNLANMQSTVRRDFGFANAHNRGFQVDTSLPLPVYPAPGAAPVEIARLQVPSGMFGKLTGLAIVHVGAAGSFNDGSGQLIWHVLVNGAPQKGLENVIAQIGTISQPSDASILLGQNDLLQVLVEVPVGQVAPVGNPFVRMLGFYDFGGSGSQAPRSTGGVAAAASVASGGTSSPTTTTPTTTPTTSPTGTYSGGSGGTSAYSCFSGNVAVETALGFVSFEQLPRDRRFAIRNDYGLFMAELLVHEYDGEMLRMSGEELVTPEHLMRGKGWQRADHYFIDRPRVHFRGEVFNLHIFTDFYDAQCYRLKNGAIAHNAKARTAANQL